MSIWTDLQDRSSGKVLKKEDNIFKGSEDITPDELVKMLKQGIVHFIYKKKAKKGQPADSGETREAWGTKQMDVIDKVPHGGSIPAKRYGYITYFDLTVGDWRVFREDRILGVWDNIYTQEEFEKIYDILNKK